MRSNPAWRLNWRLSNFFNFGIPDLILLIKAWIAFRTASKLGGTAFSQKYQGSVAKMIKKGWRLFWRLGEFLEVKLSF